MYYNSKGEKICYINRTERGKILNVYMSGETFPNPDYLISHNTESSHRWDHYVFEYVLEGRGYIEAEGEKHTVSAGDFYFLNKLKRHIYYSDPEEPYHKQFIVFFGVLADRLISAYGFDGSLLIKKVDLKAEFAEICEITADADNQINQAQQNRIAILLHEIIQKVAEPLYFMPEADSNVGLAERVKFYIDNNLTESLSLDDMSRYFYVSKTHIINKFREKYKLTPMKYAQEQRVSTASHLLMSTDLSIREISELLKFSDSKAFTKSFCQIVGEPPKKFRMRYKTQK